MLSPFFNLITLIKYRDKMKQSFSTSVILKVVNPELDSGDLVNESLRTHEILSG